MKSLPKLHSILSVPEQLALAKEIARKGHKGQTRKFKRLPNGKKMPYIIHPARIARVMRERYPNEPAYEIVAWLHDIVEDTPMTGDDLLELGIGEEYVVMVEALSRREGETYYDFIMRMKFSHMSRRVKIGDVEDNLNDGLKEGSMKDKYRLALYVLKYFDKEAEKMRKKD